MTPDEIEALTAGVVLISELLQDEDVVALLDTKVVEGISLTDRLRCFMTEPAVVAETERWIKK